MKCLSCNVTLTDYEATRKYTDGTFLDLCCRCHKKSDMDDISIVDRPDLQEDEEEDHGYVTLTAPMGWPHGGE